MEGIAQCSAVLDSWLSQHRKLTEDSIPPSNPDCGHPDLPSRGRHTPTLGLLCLSVFPFAESTLHLISSGWLPQCHIVISTHNWPSATSSKGSGTPRPAILSSFYFSISALITFYVPYNLLVILFIAITSHWDVSLEKQVSWFCSLFPVPRSTW